MTWKVGGRTLVDWMVGSSEIDGRDKGIWTIWEAFFGLRSKGELTEQGAL